MQHATWLLVIVTITMLATHASCTEAGSNAASASAAAASPTTRPGGGVVVELFTSEGCSSCPPADALLSKLAQDYASRSRPVFFLAFHVDYWDHLGWKDLFGDGQFTRRQGDYARAFAAESIYTPQMIVNGTTEFVGSDRERAVAAIDRALDAPAPLSIRMEIDRDDQEFSIRCHVDAVPADALLNIAVVESQLSSDVARGENRGRTLAHDQVVRLFKQQPLKALDQTVQIKLPSSAKLDRVRVIAFVQRIRTLEIVGAADIAIQTQTQPESR